MNGFYKILYLVVVVLMSVFIVLVTLIFAQIAEHGFIQPNGVDGLGMNVLFSGFLFLVLVWYVFVKVYIYLNKKNND